MESRKPYLATLPGLIQGAGKREAQARKEQL